MKAETQVKIAIDALKGNRGKLIMGRALQIAINHLENQADEESTVCDMRFFRDVMFRWGGDYQLEIDKQRKAL